MNRLLAILAALLLAAPLSAKEPKMPDKSALAAPAFTTINGSPLRINIGADNSYQIFNTLIPGGIGQIYPSTAQQTADMGWLVRIGSTLYAPNFGEHPGGTATGGIGSAIDYTETSLGTVGGSGTAASPYTVSVATTLGASGLTAIKTTSYVNGDGYFTERFRLINSSGAGTVQATVYLASDIYLASSDSGKPFREPTSGSPGGTTCAGVNPVYTILHIPLTPADRFTAASYSSVWSQIGGGALNNQVDPAPCIDNGAALQWNRNVPLGGSSSVLAATSFGDVPPITQFNILDVNPAQGVIGTTVAVTITGYGFLPATTFNFGPRITVNNPLVINSTTATATLVIADNAQLGYRDVVATQVPGGLVATLLDGFAVTEPPIWNYSIISINNVNQAAITCVRQKFPANPATNAAGWAPTEGDFYHENPQLPWIMDPPNGLARAILDCFMGGRSWDSVAGMLYPAYCWDNPTPWYQGTYPDLRVAQLRVYYANNFVCEGPMPGWPMLEENVALQRQLFYPTPVLRNGFESY